MSLLKKSQLSVIALSFALSACFPPNPAVSPINSPAGENTLNPTQGKGVQNTVQPGEDAPLPEQAAPVFEDDEVTRLTPEKLAALSPEDIKTLTLTQITLLSNEQIKALTPQQVSAILPQQFFLMSTNQFQQLSTAQLKAISPLSMSYLDIEKLTSLTPEQFAELSAEQVNALTTGEEDTEEPAPVEPPPAPVIQIGGEALDVDAIISQIGSENSLTPEPTFESVSGTDITLLKPEERISPFDNSADAEITEPEAPTLPNLNLDELFESDPEEDSFDTTEEGSMENLLYPDEGLTDDGTSGFEIAQVNDARAQEKLKKYLLELGVDENKQKLLDLSQPLQAKIKLKEEFILKKIAPLEENWAKWQSFYKELKDNVKKQSCQLIKKSGRTLLTGDEKNLKLEEDVNFILKNLGEAQGLSRETRRERDKLMKDFLTTLFLEEDDSIFIQKYKEVVVKTLNSQSKKKSKESKNSFVASFVKESGSMANDFFKSNAEKYFPTKVESVEDFFNIFKKAVDTIINEAKKQKECLQTYTNELPCGINGNGKTCDYKQILDEKEKYENGEYHQKLAETVAGCNADKLTGSQKNRLQEMWENSDENAELQEALEYKRRVDNLKKKVKDDAFNRLTGKGEPLEGLEDHVTDSLCEALDIYIDWRLREVEAKIEEINGQIDEYKGYVKMAYDNPIAKLEKSMGPGVKKLQKRPKQIKHLSPNVIKKIRPSIINKLGSKLLRSFTKKQIRAMSSTQLNAIHPSVVRKLSRKFWKKVPVLRFRELNKTIVRQFDWYILTGISYKRFKGLNKSYIQDIDLTRFSNAKLASFPLPVFDVLAKKQILKLSSAKILSLSDDKQDYVKKLLSKLRYKVKKNYKGKQRNKILRLIDQKLALLKVLDEPKITLQALSNPMSASVGSSVGFMVSSAYPGAKHIRAVRPMPIAYKLRVYDGSKLLKILDMPNISRGDTEVLLEFTNETGEHNIRVFCYRHRVVNGTVQENGDAVAKSQTLKVEFVSTAQIPSSSSANAPTTDSVNAIGTFEGL